MFTAEQTMTCKTVKHTASPVITRLTASLLRNFWYILSCFFVILMNRTCSCFSAVTKSTLLLFKKHFHFILIWFIDLNISLRFESSKKNWFNQSSYFLGTSQSSGYLQMRWFGLTSLYRIFKVHPNTLGISSVCEIFETLLSNWNR